MPSIIIFSNSYIFPTILWFPFPPEFHRDYGNQVGGKVTSFLSETLTLILLRRIFDEPNTFPFQIKKKPLVNISNFRHFTKIQIIATIFQNSPVQGRSSRIQYLPQKPPPAPKKIQKWPKIEIIAFKLIPKILRSSATLTFQNKFSKIFKFSK